MRRGDNINWFTIHTDDDDIDEESMSQDDMQVIKLPSVSDDAPGVFRLFTSDEESMSHDGMRVIKLPRVSDPWAEAMHEAALRLEDTLNQAARESAMVEAYLADHPDEYARIDMLASSPDPKARMLAYDMLDDIRSMVSRRREGGHAGSPQGLDWGN